MAAFGQGGMPTIAVVNKSTVDLGVPFKQLVITLQTAYDLYFKPVWGYPVSLVMRDPKPNEWQFIFFDDADAADAEGYHDLTKDGQPVSKVFVKDTLKVGDKISATASHELFEMAMDPNCDLWARGPGGVFYAYEMSDAVEDTEFTVNGISISNFVHPSFFENFDHPSGTKFDHLGVLTKPFETSKNGYQTIIDPKKGKGMHDIFGSKAKERKFAKENRFMHRSEYRKERHPE